jgi:DNA-binding MarR family transcriptional regulator
MSSRSVEQKKTTPEAVAAELRALDRSLDLLDEGVAISFGITRSDLRAMELVSADGRLTAGQLARGLGVTTGAVTGLIDRMERIGYFQRQDDPSDRRKVFVVLTSKAKARERRAFERLGRETERMLSSYRDEDLALIGDFLRRVRAIVDQLGGRPESASSASEIPRSELQ